jgi:addiction module HigA family antidote
MAVHPGIYIRQNVMPPDLTLAQAARQMGVTSSALARVLSGETNLSAQWAMRFSRAFGADKAILLAMQHEFEHYRQREKVVLGLYAFGFF